MSTVQQPHWPCGAQPSFTSRATELVAQRVEEGAARGDVDVDAVEPERDGGRVRGRLGQLNELPQPQVCVAFGFVMWNPAPCSPSE